jgi:peptidoglycan hydrolase FlgJ
MNSLINPSAIAATHDDGKLESLRVKSLGSKTAKMSEEEMRDVAKQFEGMVVRQLLKEMRKTVPNDGLIERSFATEMYTDIADDHLANQMSENKGVGIGDMIYEELKERNKTMASKEDLDKESDFVKLKPGQNPAAQKGKFVSLDQDMSTEHFLDLHRNKSTNFDLPNTETVYVPLDSRSRISSDKISVE